MGVGKGLMMFGWKRICGEGEGETLLVAGGCVFKLNCKSFLMIVMEPKCFLFLFLCQ